MIKAFFAVLTMALSLTATAANSITEVLVLEQQAAIMDQAHTQSLLNWKVGDQNSYDLDMGFIKGSMVMSVRSVGEEGIWMVQDMDLGFAGKQKAEILLDQNTGEIKKFLVNGQEQQVPKQDMEVIDTTEDHITVPAGTFDCIHARLRDKQQNSEINTWINPQIIPLSGMIKTIQPNQFGTMTVVLKSFKKN